MKTLIWATVFRSLNSYVSAEITKITGWIKFIHRKSDDSQRKATCIHDLNLLSVYCVGWDLTDLLQEGFTGVAGRLRT